MDSPTPVTALGIHTSGVRDLLVEVIRARHELAAEAHSVGGSRYAMDFGTQWRDLLDDVKEALVDRGFQSHKLAPAGYKLPVVNDSLIYVWRAPGAPDAVTRFASSPTRRNGFSAEPPPAMLFEPDLDGEPEADDASSSASEEAKVERVVRAASGTMPVVLVILHSSPRQLQSIEWAVAELADDGTVSLSGLEAIWEPEANVDVAMSDVESFDSGSPAVPAVGLQPREGADPNAG